MNQSQQIINFEDCLQQYKKHKSKIPEQLRQKLNFLEFSILNNSNEEIEIDQTQYPDLDVQEIEGLFRLPIEKQKNMFCSIFLSLAQQEDDSIVEGQLQSKGETLGLWSNKKLELNLTQKRLKVFRSEGIVEMNLSKYGIAWQGNKKQLKQYCFALTSINAKQYDHYKQLTLGSDDEAYTKKWYNMISKCVSECEQQDPKRRFSQDVEVQKAIVQMKSSEVLNNKPWLSQTDRISTDLQNQQPTQQIKKKSINSNSNAEKGKPDYLNDLRIGMFLEGKFHRVDDQIYKSISKDHLYQIQFKVNSQIEKVMECLYSDNTFNKFINDEQVYMTEENYVIVKQRRQFKWFKQEIGFIRYKGIDIILEKQLGVSDPMYNIIKLFKNEDNTITTVQMLSYIQANWVLWNFEIEFLQQYCTLNSHLQYMNQFKQLDFEFNIADQLSQSSEESLDLMDIPIQQENIKPTLTQEELLKEVLSGKYAQWCLNRIQPAEPFQTEPKFQKSGVQGHFLLKYYWKIDTKNGGLLYIDEEGIKQQKKVFSYLMSKIGSNIMEGKSITNISLPVNIFEKQSNLSRYASTMAYLQYLDKSVGKTTLEQLKNFIPFGYSTVILYINIQKPFNPILGETYQGYINGCPVYAEQVSHHPPISNQVIYGRGYKVYQRLCTLASMSPNSVTGVNQGYTKVVFDDGNEFYFLPCAATYYGTLYGDKLFQLTGKFHIIDINNKYVAEVKMNPVPSSMWKRTREHLDDYFEGRLYQVNDDFVKRFKKDGFMKFKELKQNEIINEVFKIHGVWHKDMYIDNELVWNINQEPYVLENEEFPLPSDANFREDLISWRMDNFDLAMKNKTKLEELQRGDAKLRKAHKH